MNVFSSAKTIIFAFAIDRMNPGVHCLLPLLLLLRYFSKKKKANRAKKRDKCRRRSDSMRKKIPHLYLCVVFLSKFMYKYPSFLVVAWFDQVR